MRYCNKSKTQILIYNDVLGFRRIVNYSVSIVIFNKYSDFSWRSRQVLNTVILITIWHSKIHDVPSDSYKKLYLNANQIIDECF